MPKIPYAQEGQQEESATAVYEQLKSGFGMVPNLVKLVGHPGAATQGLGTLLDVYFSKLSIDTKTREIAYLTVARHNGCAFCQGHHTPLAKQAGFPQDKVELLGPDGVNSDKLEPAERAVVRFAWETSKNVEASDDAVEELKKHFDTKQVAEIAFVVASANFIQRIGRNLGVELEW